MDAMGGILTKGLGAPACCGLIIAKFGLSKCCQYTIEVIPVEGIGGGGGSRPLAPGEIHNFYTPVGQTNPLKPLQYLQPYNDLRGPVDKIVITLTTSDGNNHTKEFFVPRHKSRVLINVTRIIASIGGFVHVTTSNIQTRLRDRITIIANNLRKKDK